MNVSCAFQKDENQTLRQFVAWIASIGGPIPLSKLRRNVSPPPADRTPHISTPSGALALTARSRDPEVWTRRVPGGELAGNS